MPPNPLPPAGDLALYWRLFSYVLPYKWVFASALAGMLMIAASDVGLAWLLQPIMDRGFIERDMQFIHWIPVIVILLAVTRAIGAFVSGYCMSWVSLTVVQNLRQKMFERLIYAPTTFYNHESSGRLVARLTYDVEQVAAASAGAFRTLFLDLAKSILLIGLMVILSWQLSLIFITIIPPALFIFKYAGNRFRQISMRLQASVGDITNIARQAFQGHRLVKIFNGYDTEKRAFGAANNHNRQQSMKKAALLSISAPLVVLIMGIGVAGIIWLALILDTQTGIFTAYLVSMTMLARPIQNLSKINEAIQTGMAGAQSIFSTLDIPIERDTGTVKLRHVTGQVEFRAVSFRYESAPADTQTLSQISFTIPAGQTVALVGPSGSGKTTIASLLMRFYHPTSGEILLDDHPLAQINLAAFRSKVAVVSQDVILFDDSIRNNILYGAGDKVDEKKFAQAVEIAHVRDFTETLERKLDTLVGETGARLSGGERQRVAIARALYKDTPILILDEATSSLDVRSEHHIQQALTELIRNRTTLVIAHRLNTIEQADLILVIEDGEIIERGSHQQLIADHGVYRQLHQRQFQDSPRAPKPKTTRARRAR